MKLTFLGTRGYIEPTSPRHRRHTSTMISHRGVKVMIDCGEDWLGRLSDLEPDAIVITHAHPDHALGLKHGSPCAVFAAAAAWEKINNFPIREEFRKLLKPRKVEQIGGIMFEPFPVIHSLLAPTVGYRISAGKSAIFYVPDVFRIVHLAEAFSGIRLYVGDGATIARSLVRREKWTGRLMGHASIETQLGWCRKQGVKKMVVTHCGSAIVRAGEDAVKTKIKELARKYGVKIDVAQDGMELLV